jgi:DNA-directed RNA polymerase specialized sigma24 family protein
MPSTPQARWRSGGSRASRAERLRAALATLPLEQRRALLLAAFLGRTAREIGALDGTPIGTVKTRIRTAMMRLHATFEVGDA